MTKIRVFFLSILLVLVSMGQAQNIRKSVWHGQFYPGRADDLSRQLEAYLDKAQGNDLPSGDVVALIAPHAGYIYSGQVAAHAYSQVRGKTYSTVVIIGTSHRHGFEGCSIYLKGGYETPLGIVEVDEKNAISLVQETGFTFIPEAHRNEHSVEVQIPFIQKTLPQADILPIVMGYPKKRTIEKLAFGLAKVFGGQSALVVASTDLSHFHPKAEASVIDNETISLVRDMKTKELIRKLERGEGIMCGGGPVVASILYAQKIGEPRVEVLKYADSSDAGGPRSEVVGYLAASISVDSSTRKFILSASEKKALLELARSAIEMFVKNGRIFDSPPAQGQKSLFSKKGAFVTLKKNGRLRGCIGFIKPALPLYQTVIQAATFAAVRDTRFSPVKAVELKDLEIEISVLTPLQKIEDPNAVRVGRHGLVISSKDGRTGLLLPQVAVENRWSRRTFLEQTCLKAGLPKDAWKKGADIHIFQAVVFH